MIAKELGSTGVFIPEVGIGTWNYRGGPELLRKGIEAGAVFIDTAESYGTEPMVRQSIEQLRDRAFIATKVSPQNFSAANLRKSADSSLQRLGIDRIDLFQLHHPNPRIPIEETMDAMARLIDDGKVRFAGVSNFSVIQLREAQKALVKYPVVSNQVRYNVIDRTIENALLEYCQAQRITVIAYSPLGRGLSRIMECDPTGVISELVHATGKTPAQIVINWCVCKDGVIAIPGGNSERHILENCGASDWRLSDEQLALLDARIRFRHRNRFDTMVRQYMPRTLQQVGLKILKYLPGNVRRRIV